jgi:hypothetical protein
MLKSWFVFTGLVVFADRALAQPSLFSKYPDPPCQQPEFEVLPQAEDAKTPDQAKANLYDYEVRQYNREVEAYDACMHNYISKANRDAEKIRSDANEEVKRILDNANASIANVRAHIERAEAEVKKTSNTPPSALVKK